jgi:hypothetical protein
MKKKEYQVGTVTFTKVEEGWLSNWLVERSATGWTLNKTERYFSKTHNEECLFWVLERDFVEV